MLVVVVLVNMFVPHVLSREKIFTIEARDISSLNVNTFYVFVSFLAGGTTSLAQRRWHNVAGTSRRTFSSSWDRFWWVFVSFQLRDFRALEKLKVNTNHMNYIVKWAGAQVLWLRKPTHNLELNYTVIKSCLFVENLYRMSSSSELATKMNCLSLNNWIFGTFWKATS